MPILKTSQELHDLTVMRIADYYVRQGFQVWVDLPNYAKPPNLLGCIPDIYVEKQSLLSSYDIKTIVVIEVETQDTISSTETKIQVQRLRSWAASNGAEFRLEMAS